MLVDLLHEEVKPAAGCTEPVAVALAAAKATEVLGLPPGRLVVGVSPNIYKNGFAVMLPGVMEAGLELAAALGSVRARSADGLKVLNRLTASEIAQARAQLEAGQVRVELLDTREKVLVRAVAESKCGTSSVQVTLHGRHDRIVEVIKDDHIVEVSLDHPWPSSVAPGACEGAEGLETSQESHVLQDLTLGELISLVAEMPPEPLEFLQEGLTMNRAMAALGMASPTGLGTAYALKSRYAPEGGLRDLTRLAMTMTAGASDARMAGVDLPVMSSNGSGNNGITAILPLAAYFELNPTAPSDQVRALALSHLINSYIKGEIGRLSALCSCGIAAASGASAAIAWLETRDPLITERTIINMIANLSGMICDGAKLGCALKLATAAATAVETAGLTQAGICVPAGNGLVASTAEQTVKNLGRLSRHGLQLADAVLLSIQRENAHG